MAFGIMAAILMGMVMPLAANAFPKMDSKAFQTKFQKGTGKWRIIIIWGSWCTTCEEDFRSIGEVWKARWAKEPVELWTIVLDGDSTKAQAEALFKRAGVKWETFMPASETDRELIFNSIDPRWKDKVPHFVFFDPQGERHMIRSGYFPGKRLDHSLTRMTGRKAEGIRAEEQRLLNEAWEADVEEGRVERARKK